MSLSISPRTTHHAPLLIIVGPTAVGKTAVGVALCESLGGEIVSADAVAVYRGLDIGAAKPDASERARARFHLIDVAEPHDDFTVAEFETLAGVAIDDIRSRGKLPIVVGGTGLYVRSLAATLALPGVAAQPEIRERLTSEAEQIGGPAMHARLAQVDTVSAGKILPGDVRRIVRALEVWEATGKPLSSFHTPEGVRGIPKPGVIVVGLDRTRESLYERIDARVDIMLESGFLTEVSSLLTGGVAPDCKAMGSLGYRHLAGVVRGKTSLDDAVELLKRDTRRFAKRQLSWFRNDPQVEWVTIEDGESAGEIAARVRNLWESGQNEPTGISRKRFRDTIDPRTISTG